MAAIRLQETVAHVLPLSRWANKPNAFSILFFSGHKSSQPEPELEPIPEPRPYLARSALNWIQIVKARCCSICSGKDQEHCPCDSGSACVLPCLPCAHRSFSTLCVVCSLSIILKFVVLCQQNIKNFIFDLHFLYSSLCGSLWLPWRALCVHFDAVLMGTSSLWCYGPTRLGYVPHQS